MEHKLKGIAERNIVTSIEMRREGRRRTESESESESEREREINNIHTNNKYNNKNYNNNNKASLQDMVTPPKVTC